MLSSSLMHCSSRVHMHKHVCIWFDQGALCTQCAHTASDDCRKTGSLTNELANQRAQPMATARYIYQHDRPRPAPRAVPTFATTAATAATGDASRSSAPILYADKAGELEQALCNCREEGKGKHRAQIDTEHTWILVGLGCLQLKHFKRPQYLYSNKNFSSIQV